MSILRRIERALVVLAAYLLLPRRDYFPDTARRFIKREPGE